MFGSLERLSVDELDFLADLITRESEGVHWLDRRGCFQPHGLQGIVNEIVRSRFAIGAGFYATIEGDFDWDSEYACRNVISRAYYAAYHFYRAVLFHTVRKDYKRHDEIIQAVRKSRRRLEAEEISWLHEWRNACDYQLPGKLRVPNAFTSFGEFAFDIRNSVGILGYHLRNELTGRGVSDLEQISGFEDS